MGSGGAAMEIGDFAGVGSGVDGAMAAGGGTVTGARAGRRDGRGSLEMRALTVSHGVLARADGSARLRAGGTEVLASVHGPTECPVPKQDPEKCAVVVHFRQRKMESGAEMAAVAHLRDIVAASVLAALHPRKMLSVTVHVLADDGGVGAAAVNAVALALLDAGTPLVHVPVASTVSVVGGCVVVDPKKAEEAEADGVITFTFPGSEKLATDYSAVSSTGDCGDMGMFFKASDAAHSLATQTLAFMRLSVERKQELPRAY